ncbi:hypothetical protein [Sporolactobacillus putidus]|uniref:Uncharacterized protein n=1 Tax=Sporolactobacillus putidus TaxID=492735 RepID=A0A917S7R9_9BACL|nr:hypothetical protein [Sporolactobacillus putidus]GGL60496.1 hypothetical protein GCM10007968_25640 [Sporolactobacillus putidus]
MDDALHYACGEILSVDKEFEGIKSHSFNKRTDERKAMAYIELEKALQTDLTIMIFAEGTVLKPKS